MKNVAVWKRLTISIFEIEFFSARRYWKCLYLRYLNSKTTQANINIHLAIPQTLALNRLRLNTVLPFHVLQPDLLIPTPETSPRVLSNADTLHRKMLSLNQLREKEITHITFHPMIRGASELAWDLAGYYVAVDRHAQLLPSKSNDHGELHM